MKVSIIIPVLNPTSRLVTLTNELIKNKFNDIIWIERRKYVKTKKKPTRQSWLKRGIIYHTFYVYYTPKILKTQYF